LPRSEQRALRRWLEVAEGASLAIHRSDVELYKEMFDAITDFTELVYGVFLNAQFAFE
jgi:hypothetical protein